MQRKIIQIFKRKFQSEDEDVQTNTSEGEDEKVKSRNANCIEEPTETPGPSSSGDPFVLPEYPSIWTKDQYEQFKEKNEWIFAKNGMLGCQKCHTVKDLGVASTRGVNIAPNWVAGKICPSGHTRDVQLSSLRKKIHDQDFAFETTARVFRTAYYVAKYNKPFTDFESLIDLQETNSINMGRVLHSKTVCVDIVDHVASQMKKEIMKRIIQNRSKITVLADESTNVGNKSTLIVFVKASVDGAMEPIAFPLDLVDLDSLCAAHIKEKLINCLLKNGFTMQLLQELLIGFCSDGASVMLGVKSGVGKLLKDDFPSIVLWHCLNHTLELAVDQALDKTGGTKDFQAFLDSLYSLYSQSPKNMRELSECARNLHITLKRIGRVFSVRWVASSWRAVNAVWQSYSALAQHFQKFSGLLSKLCTVHFLKSLALMVDNRKTTIPKAHELMTNYLKRIESLKTYPGKHTVEAEQADSVTANRKEAYNSLINQMAVLHPENLDQDNPRFGEVEVRTLCERLVEFKASGGRSIPPPLKKILLAVDTLSASNADCERGFSTMNNIMTDLRGTMTTKNVSNLLFISSFGPPCMKWDPMPYVKTWLGKGRRPAHTTSGMARRSPKTDEEYYQPLWDIMT
uniref:E3 SUMO-protein ligase KIAA1586-like n=1 Tax=Oryzias sinensis TaxID=183150 RepID=A0A8C7YBF1_9TELE